MELENGAKKELDNGRCRKPGIILVEIICLFCNKQNKYVCFVR